MERNALQEQDESGRTVSETGKPGTGLFSGTISTSRSNAGNRVATVMENRKENNLASTEEQSELASNHTISKRASKKKKNLNSNSAQEVGKRNGEETPARNSGNNTE